MAFHIARPWENNSNIFEGRKMFIDETRTQLYVPERETRDYVPNMRSTLSPLNTYLSVSTSLCDLPKRCTENDHYYTPLPSIQWVTSSENNELPKYPMNSERRSSDWSNESEHSNGGGDPTIHIKRASSRVPGSFLNWHIPPTYVNSEPQTPQAITYSVSLPPLKGGATIFLGSSGKELPSSSSQSVISRKLKLNIFGGSIQCIKRLAWSQCEDLEGRRIVRLHKTLNGAAVEVIFVPVRPSQYTNCLKFVEDDFLEVSCIKFLHQDGITTDFLITSAEVIKIIEFLLGSSQKKTSLLRKERGRIRSNLASLWHKNPSPMDSTETRRLRSQILKYESRKPYNILKDMRMLLWDDLESAIRKALLFYLVIVSD